MHAFDILGDPVRRRILELLADGEQPAGAIGAVVQREFGISQPGVSQHLRVLRENGFATVRVDGPRRIYSADPAPLAEVDVWLERYRRFWAQRLDALGTEIKRGRRERRLAARPGDADPGPTGPEPTAESRTDRGDAGSSAPDTGRGPR